MLRPNSQKNKIIWQKKKILIFYFNVWRAAFSEKRGKNHERA